MEKYLNKQPLNYLEVITTPFDNRQRIERGFVMNHMSRVYRAYAKGREKRWKAFDNAKTEQEKKFWAEESVFWIWCNRRGIYGYCVYPY